MPNISDKVQIEDLHLFVKGVEGLVRFKARSTAVLEAGCIFPLSKPLIKDFINFTVAPITLLTSFIHTTSKKVFVPDTLLKRSMVLLTSGIKDFENGVRTTDGRIV